MSILMATWGTARVGLMKIFTTEQDSIEPQYKDVVGRIVSTKQEYEIFKQVSPLGLAQDTPEGSSVVYESQFTIATKTATPIKKTHGIRYSIEAKYTDQYGRLAKLMPDLARSFQKTKNVYVASLDNLGFTDTTMGVGTETLYSATHAQGSGPTFSNLGTPTAFGPLAVKQMITDIRNQRDARNLKIGYTGKILIKVPTELEGDLWTILNTMKLPGTANNDANYVRSRIEGAVNDSYSSPTGYFGRAMDEKAHGLFLLTSMPFTLKQFPEEDDFMVRFGAYESYVTGWYDAHGVSGNVGA